MPRGWDKSKSREPQSEKEAEEAERPSSINSASFHRAPPAFAPWCCWLSFRMPGFRNPDPVRSLIAPVSGRDLEADLWQQLDPGSLYSLPSAAVPMFQMYFFFSKNKIKGGNNSSICLSKPKKVCRTFFFLLHDDSSTLYQMKSTLVTIHFVSKPSDMLWEPKKCFKSLWLCLRDSWNKNVSNL